MRMECRALFRARYGIVDGDLNSISPIGLNQRPWVCAIDQQLRFGVPIRRDCTSSNVERVASDNACIRVILVWVGI